MNKLEDIVCYQGYNQCAPSSFVNGFITLNDNYILNQSNNKNKIIHLMNNLVKKFYDVNNGDSLINSKFRYNWEMIPEHHFTTAFENIPELNGFNLFEFYFPMKLPTNKSFEQIKELFEKKEGFIISHVRENHFVCVYKYEDEKYYFKEPEKNLKLIKPISQKEFEKCFKTRTFYVITKPMKIELDYYTFVSKPLDI